MQLQPQKEFTTKNQSHGYHSPTYREPMAPRLHSDSSSFNFQPDEFFAHGTTYGNYPFTVGYSPNPDYEDDELYGPGFDDPFSSFYAFHLKK